MNGATLTASASANPRAPGRRLPGSLRHVPTCAASALDWLTSLHDTGFAYHLDDSPETVIDGRTGAALFRPEDCATVRAGVAAVRALDLSGLPIPAAEAAAHYDAFAFLAYLEAMHTDDDGNGVAGCLPGVRLEREGGGFILLDCMRGPDWTWGARGRFSLNVATGDDLDPVGDLLGEYDTPEGAARACPAFAAVMREQDRETLTKAAAYWAGQTTPEAPSQRARVAASLAALEA